jgi:imidazole glycerol-phosphate synthase subunit HisH
VIAVLDSGTGNLRSVEKAIAAAGGEVTVTSDPDVVRRADKIVVPGQGAFRDCVAGLRARGLDGAVRESIAAGKPYLGICLGLQILFDESEEHGPCAGLGILPGRVVRFRPTVDAGGRALKVPHMGWNEVRPTTDDPLWHGLGDTAHVYFVHSYYVIPSDPSMIALTCDYGVPFCAAVRHDNIFATQFHPEKSQRIGLTILRNFVGGPA